ncbi:hypothetical protein [Cohnella thermotolerans]|uniref:hypothetical protein n=1 Tax=Cohnella thermotolerans TaxID=329858 RepID=UPI00047E75CC|nr:hypothetical protein [Cohnella thermotolerans]
MDFRRIPARIFPREEASSSLRDLACNGGAVPKVDKSTESQLLEARNKRGEERLSRLFACLVFHNHRFLQEERGLALSHFHDLSNVAQISSLFGRRSAERANVAQILNFFGRRSAERANVAQILNFFGRRSAEWANVAQILSLFSRRSAETSSGLSQTLI